VNRSDALTPGTPPPPTARLRFGKWSESDLPLALALWGDSRVTALIGGPFDEARVAEMLQAQLASDREAGVQYWPLFVASSGDFAGCCGLRPRKAGQLELGFHLRPEHRGKGFAAEAARAVIAFAFGERRVAELFAGHHPRNVASARTLRTLGFRHSHEELYPPTGLLHPSYVLTAEEEATARRIRESYDRVAPAYAQNLFSELDHKPLDRALLDAFAEAVRGRGPVVDVGCGPGQVARYLEGRAVSISGLDLSPAMVETASRLAPAIRFRQGSMLSLPDPDESWAGCVAFYAIVHLRPPELASFAHEMHRVLRPDGLLLLSFHQGNETVHRDELFGAAVDLDFLFFESDTVVRALQDAGFRIEARVERAPYVGHEYPSQRVYLLARKSA
jgi:RimJ/RimL family protein N-acetyltransferase/SAM-dependent methyltransferase